LDYPKRWRCNRRRYCRDEKIRLDEKTVLMKKLRRKIRSRFSIAAPHLKVRPHLPWHWRWGIAAAAGIIVVCLVWWVLSATLGVGGFPLAQTGQAARQLSDLHDENAALASKLVDYERQLQMERATNTELTRQLKALNDEKSTLKDDLMFYQNLTQAGGKGESLTIQKLRVERGSLPGEYHCSLLLVQGGQRPKDFRGNVQLLVSTRQNNTSAVLTLPQASADATETQAYQLDFKYYQRVERSFRLPDDAALKGIQVRVYERGVTGPIVKQDATLPS
jgi:hypothetical protein